jgi:hypothetical protein
MKKILLIIILLTSIIAIGQKNNFYGESGNQYYKLKVDKATYDILSIEDGTIFFHGGIQGDCFYSSGILTIKNLFYPVTKELRFQNDYQKQDELNYNLNKMIQIDIQLSVRIKKMNTITESFIGHSKDEMKKVFEKDKVFRESTNFLWLTSGFVLYFDEDGGFTNIEYKRI